MTCRRTDCNGSSSGAGPDPELRGDRIGVIAFAGRAFVQAPLTIDYDAAVTALNELDTNIIPEGGTNISEAITLAVKTFGKSAIGNRALIIFTDGEELAGDSGKVAKEAADAGVQIFTIGVGTPEGRSFRCPQENGTAFVKDSSGQVVKSKLDEKRLREIAQKTGGMFLPLGEGPATMRKLYDDGLAKCRRARSTPRCRASRSSVINGRSAAALLALSASLLVSERKTTRARTASAPRNEAPALATPALISSAPRLRAARPRPASTHIGRNNSGRLRALPANAAGAPDTRATDKIQFDAGAAAYKMKDYGKALQSFSQALLSPNPELQSRSHYNLGNTLYQRGEGQKAPRKKCRTGRTRSSITSKRSRSNRRTRRRKRTTST